MVWHQGVRGAAPSGQPESSSTFAPDALLATDLMPFPQARSVAYCSLVPMLWSFVAVRLNMNPPCRFYIRSARQPHSCAAPGRCHSWLSGGNESRHHCLCSVQIYRDSIPFGHRKMLRLNIGVLVRPYTLWKRKGAMRGAVPGANRIAPVWRGASCPTVAATLRL